MTSTNGRPPKVASSPPWVSFCPKILRMAALAWCARTMFGHNIIADADRRKRNPSTAAASAAELDLCSSPPAVVGVVGLPEFVRTDRMGATYDTVFPLPVSAHSTTSPWLEALPMSRPDAGRKFRRAVTSDSATTGIASAWNGRGPAGKWARRHAVTGSLRPMSSKEDGGDGDDDTVAGDEGWAYCCFSLVRDTDGVLLRAYRRTPNRKLFLRRPKRLAANRAARSDTRTAVVVERLAKNIVFSAARHGAVPGSVALHSHGTTQTRPTKSSGTAIGRFLEFVWVFFAVRGRRLVV